MNELDETTFTRFTARYARIERLVPEPPPLGVVTGTHARPHRSTVVVPVLLGAVLVLAALLGLAVVGSQLQHRPVTVPPVSAGPEVVLDAYLTALTAGDCTTAGELVDPGVFQPGRNDLCGVREVRSYEITSGPTTVGGDGQYGIGASVGFVTQLEVAPTDRLPGGTGPWFYQLHYQVGVGWRIVGAGSGALRPSVPLPSPPADRSPSANAWLSEAAITEAVHFREQSGLRSDLAWVQTVAQMPDAVFDYGIPMTSPELAELERRNADADAIIAKVKAYGADHPDAWAGAYIDADRNVVAMFTKDVDVHEAALRSAIGPSAPLIVRGVEWTDAELQALFERIHKDWLARTWFLDHDIYPLGLGVDTVANQVEVEVSSARTDLDPLTEARYDAAGMIEITSDGTGARLMPTGTLAGRVVDAAGNPVAGVDIELTSDVAGAGSDSEIGHGTDDKGRFRLTDVTAVAYDVAVYTFEGDVKQVLGHAKVTVHPSKTTTITITISR